MANDNRERGILLNVLDLSALAPAALEYAQREYPESGFTSVEPGFGPYGVADTDHGLFVVCNEGVGWEVTGDKPLAVECYGETKVDGKVTSFSMLPACVVYLTPAQVRGAVTEETIDLADLVRRFGDRLEVNFSIWHHKISGE
jgi:hypothetical protein